MKLESKIFLVFCCSCVLVIGGCRGEGTSGADSESLGGPPISEPLAYNELPGSLGSIPVTSEGGNIHPDSIFEQVEFVPLETREGFIVGEIDQVFVTDTRIVVVDKKTLSIIIYTRDGKALKHIHSAGKGPEDYLNLDGVGFDPDTGLIYVYNWHSVLKYNLEGELVEIQKIEPDKRFSFSSFYVHNGYFISDLFESGAEHQHFLRLSFYDREALEFSGGCFVTPAGFRGSRMVYRRHADFLDGKMYYLSIIENGIFEVGPNHVNKIYDFDIREKDRMTRAMMMMPPKASRDQRKGRIFHMDFFVITRDHVVFRTMPYFVYSRSSGKMKSFVFVEYTPHYLLYLDPVAKYEDYLIRVAPVKQYNRLTGQNIDPDANPALMFYKLKKF